MRAIINKITYFFQILLDCDSEKGSNLATFFRERKPIAAKHPLVLGEIINQLTT